MSKPRISEIDIRESPQRTTWYQTELRRPGYRHVLYRTTTVENTPFEPDFAARHGKRLLTARSASVRPRPITDHRIRCPHFESHTRDVDPSRFENHRICRTLLFEMPCWYQTEVRGAALAQSPNRTLQAELGNNG